ncbi:hypothetical protein BT69DRAFT_1283729, partial [Atractiella rhizophila]
VLCGAHECGKLHGQPNLASKLTAKISRPSRPQQIQHVLAFLFTRRSISEELGGD